MSKKRVYYKPPQNDVACPPCTKLRLGDLDNIEAEAQDRISYSGKNIDAKRTHLNLFIVGTEDDGCPVITTKKYSVSLKNRVLSRINEVGVTIRQDRHPVNDHFVAHGKNTKESIVAEGIIFQISHKRTMELLEHDDLLDEKGQIRTDIELSQSHRIIRFFVDAYRFACEKWGKENIVGAYIHFDEYTPHLHIYIVPILWRPRIHKGVTVVNRSGNPAMKAHLCAKEMFNPETLTKLWSDFAHAMGSYGVSAAKGLTPKGAYDIVASMEAIKQNLQIEIEQLNGTLIDQRATIKSNEKVIKEKAFIIKELQQTISSFKPEGTFKNQLDSLVEISMDDLYDTSHIGFNKKTIKKTPKEPKEIARKVRTMQMKYDQKVIETNAEIHQEEIANLRASLGLYFAAFVALDKHISTRASKELKMFILRTGVEQFFPQTFLPEKLLQEVPWFRGLSLQRLVEIGEKNTIRSKGLWNDDETGRFIDNAFIDCSDSTDYYSIKVNLEKLTQDEIREISLFFRPIFRSLKADVKEQILKLANKGILSLKRLLHGESGNLSKKDSYQSLIGHLKASQSGPRRPNLRLK